MASLADILTTQKNGVVAINSLTTALNTLIGNFGTPTLLAQASPTGSYTVVYTCPINVTTYVKDITVCNTSAASLNFYISLVPSGDTAGIANAIFYSNALASHTTTQWSGLQVLDAGGTIQVYASASGCTFNISGAVS